MLTFAREIIGAVVHGVIALLCYYCACYALASGNHVRAAAYLVATAFECYAVFRHIEAAFPGGAK